MTKEQIEKGYVLLGKIRETERSIKQLEENFEYSVKYHKKAFISFGVALPSGGYKTFEIASRNDLIRQKLFALFMAEGNDELKKLKEELENL